MIALRHRLLSAGFAALAASRLDRLLAPLAAGSGVALTFHRVAPDPDPAAFAPNRALQVSRETLRAIVGAVRRAGFEPVAAGDLEDRLRRPRGRFALFTFDDGYRDTLEVAVPALREDGVPWTLFAVPAFLEGGGRAWWLELEACLARLDRVPWPSPEGALGPRRRLAAGGVAAKRAAFEALRPALMAAPLEVREVYLDGLCAQAGVDPAALVAEAFADVAATAAALASGDATLGSHTLAHPVLSACTDARARLEVALSRRRLEAMFGRPVRHIAFPHGDPGSCGPRESALAREAGYAFAWTTAPRHLRPGDLAGRHALPRVSMNGLHAGPAMARAVLSGVPFLGASAPGPRPQAALRS